jgi:hypothetical protein
MSIYKIYTQNIQLILKMPKERMPCPLFHTRLSKRPLFKER